MEQFHGTTIIVVKKDNQTVIAGDGQVTFGNTVMKTSAKKVKKLGDGKVLAGFAGSVADALTLLEKFEEKYRESNSTLIRAAVKLAKEWRTSKILQKLEALLVVADKENILLISGNGEVIQPDEDVIAIGSGGSYALAAAKAMVKHSDLSAKDIAEESMRIASEICIYTNSNFTIEILEV